MHTKTKILFFLFVLFGLSLSAKAVFAATYYVATNGSNSNSCITAQNSTTPKTTVNSILSCVVAGDTVLIRGGSYPGFRLTEKHYRSDAWLTIKSFPGEKAIIDGKLGQGIAIRISGASYVRFEDLETTHSGINHSTSCDLSLDSCRQLSASIASNKGIQIDGMAFGNAQSPSHDLVFSNMDIHGHGGTGILGGGDSVSDGYNFQILNSRIYDNGVRGLAEGYGTYISGRNHTIRGNQIYHNTGEGIRTGNTPDNGYYHLKDSVIENNIIYDNAGKFYHSSSGHIYDGFAGIVIWGGSNNIIRNNIVYGQRATHGYGIWVYNKPPYNNRIYNNTIYGNDNVGILLQGDGGILNTLVRNNIIYDNGRTIGGLDVDFQGTGTVSANNLIDVDPRFVDLASNNFRLTSASPAINAGATLSEVTTDFDGVSRPQGSAPDIGAYEYAGSTPPPAGGSADLNSDGRVNSVDAAMLMGAWGQTSKPKADINQDGIVNSVDASLMMGQWNP